jgi:hypothetical protein
MALSTGGLFFWLSEHVFQLSDVLISEFRQRSWSTVYDTLD